jgi:DNA polymerase-3 subunit beta
MEIKIDRKALIEALTVGGSLSGRNKTLPILECIKLAFAGRHLMVSSMDGESAIVRRVALEDEVTGTYCVHGADFIKVIRSIKEADVLLRFKEHCVEICYERGGIELPLWGVEAFPVLPKSEPLAVVTLSTSSLYRWVSHAKDFVGTDDLRPVLLGMYLYIEGNELGVCATNSHKLFTDYTYFENTEGVKTGIIIPSKVFGSLLSVLGESESVLMTVDSRNVTFAAGDAKISCRLIEGNYANFKQILPKECKSTITVRKKDLMDAVNRVSLCANAATSLIKLSIEGSILTVKGEDMDFSKLAEESFAVLHSGDNVTLGLKSDYLLTLLSSVEADAIGIEISDDRKPLLIKDGANPTTTLLMMPMLLA